MMSDNDNLPSGATPLDGVNSYVLPSDLPYIAQAKIWNHDIQQQNNLNANEWQQKSTSIATGSNFGGVLTGYRMITDRHITRTSHLANYIESRRIELVDKRKEKLAVYTKICKIAAVFFLMAILFMISDIQGRYIPFKYKWIEFFAPRIVLLISIIVIATTISKRFKSVTSEEMWLNNICASILSAMKIAYETKYNKKISSIRDGYAVLLDKFRVTNVALSAKFLYHLNKEISSTTGKPMPFLVYRFRMDLDDIVAGHYVIAFNELTGSNAESLVYRVELSDLKREADEFPRST